MCSDDPASCFASPDAGFVVHLGTCKFQDGHKYPETFSNISWRQILAKKSHSRFKTTKRTFVSVNQETLPPKKGGIKSILSSEGTVSCFASPDAGFVVHPGLQGLIKRSDSGLPQCNLWLHCDQIRTHLDQTCKFQDGHKYPETFSNISWRQILTKKSHSRFKTTKRFRSISQNAFYLIRNGGQPQKKKKLYRKRLYFGCRVV